MNTQPRMQQDANPWWGWGAPYSMWPSYYYGYGAPAYGAYPYYPWNYYGWPFTYPAYGWYAPWYYGWGRHRGRIAGRGAATFQPGGGMGGGPGQPLLSGGGGGSLGLMSGSSNPWPMAATNPQPGQLREAAA